MPYKHLSIKYGLPHKEYPKEDMNDWTECLKEEIGLESEPVGITFLLNKESYDLFPVEETQVAMPYCVMVKQAFSGKALKSRLEHHKCDGATTALGLERSCEKIESGEEYFSYELYSSLSVARRMRSQIKSLHREPVETYGIGIVPLKDCKSNPDIIIVKANPFQAMRMVQGYEYFSGKKPVIDMGAMQGMCSELTVSPYLTGEMNVSVFCPSTRMLCKWDQADMGVGIPYELFARIVEGVVATKPNY